MTITTDPPDRSAFIARAANIRPILEESADQTEAGRRLADPAVAALL